jgi:hypothetical protein
MAGQYPIHRCREIASRGLAVGGRKPTTGADRKKRLQAGPIRNNQLGCCAFTDKNEMGPGETRPLALLKKEMFERG